MLSSTCDEPSVATSATTIAYIPEMKFYNFETDWIFTALSDITNDILRERDESDSIGANAIVRGLTGYEEEGELYFDLNLNVGSLLSPITSTNGTVKISSILVKNLDTFTDFAPLLHLGNLTMGTSVVLDEIDMDLNFTFKMVPDRLDKDYNYVDGVKCTWCSSVGVRVFVTIE